MPKRRVRVSEVPHFTIRDVAEIFGVTERSVYGWLASGELVPTERVRINVIHRITFSYAALKRFSDARVGNAARRMNDEIAKRIIEEKKAA